MEKYLRKLEQTWIQKSGPSLSTILSNEKGSLLILTSLQGVQKLLYQLKTDPKYTMTDYPIYILSVSSNFTYFKVKEFVFHELHDHERFSGDLSRIIPQALSFLQVHNKVEFLDLDTAFTHVEQVRSCIDPKPGSFKVLELMNMEGLEALERIAS